jgi:hypothetical protein
MSDTVLIVLIVAAAIVVVLIALRDRVQRFFLKKNDFETGFKAGDPQPAGARVRRNWMVGTKQAIRVSQDDADVDSNTLAGKEQKIDVRPASEMGKKK